MTAFERPCGSTLSRFISKSKVDAERPRFLARNVEWDSRVSAERQGHFEGVVDELVAKKFVRNLADSLDGYRKRIVREQGWEVEGSFLDSELNRGNEIEPGSRWLRGVTEFGTVLNLSWQTERMRQEFRGAMPNEAPACDTWLKEQMERSASEQDEFLERVFRAVAKYHEEWEPYKPVWVAEWSRLRQVLEQHPRSPDEWLRFVGCEADHKYPQAIVVLKYGARDGMPPLYRPTQLDSGRNPLHFPLPGQTEAGYGGFILNLVEADGEPAAGYSCSREWIHAPFRWRPEFFAAAGRRWGMTNPRKFLKMKAIRSRRNDHLGYLKATLRDIPENWMVDADQIPLESQI